jgi:oligogalacturonide lyase
MKKITTCSMMTHLRVLILMTVWMVTASALASIGQRFPSERKVVKDPVTGVKLVFLTSAQGKGDQKIYQTHHQWTADGQWLVFRSDRVRGEAMAVHEKTGDLVQVTEGGYMGMLNLAHRSMKLYFMRAVQRGSRSVQVVEVDLETLFADSKKGKMQPPEVYQRVCGTTPESMGAGGDMALDADDEWVYFRVGREEAARYLPDSVTPYPNYGPRRMGAGPSGIAAMNVKTGITRHVVSVPFQVGHIQTNPWVPGELVFCWETGGKAPQRTWTVLADGSGLRPVYRESDRDWVTHEAVISKDEVAMAIMGHRPIREPGTEPAAGRPDPTNPGQEPGWGEAGTRESPTGLAVVNLRTRALQLLGQPTTGSGFWHVAGSSDGRWVAGDDFARNIYLIDRKTGCMHLLSTGHKPTAADHPHPTFSPDGTRIQIQSAMLSEDGRSMNICIIHLPDRLLKK